MLKQKGQTNPSSRFTKPNAMFNFNFKKDTDF